VSEPTPTRVHLVARDNGAGLSRDITVLTEAIAGGGFGLTVSALGQGGLRRGARSARLRSRLAWEAFRRGRSSRFDVNLMDERIWPNFRNLAQRNVLLPHPEWFDPRDRAPLAAIDRVFALTRHAVPIFESLGSRVDYVGFTSEDRLDRSVPRERAFFHLAGRSPNKGTEPLLALWRKHPQWPMLTVVQNPRAAKPGPPAPNIRHLIDYLDDAQLKRLQNAHRFHLCPSETEGFGHYLVEAMGIGAVTLTLDAPPMNEMITPERGLRVPTARTGTQNLATTYFYDEAAMQAAIERALALDDAQVERIGAAARTWFEHNDRSFRERIGSAVEALG